MLTGAPAIQAALIWIVAAYAGRYAKVHLVAVDGAGVPDCGQHFGGRSVDRHINGRVDHRKRT